MKVSVIDLGFNSAKMVNYDVNKDGSHSVYRQEAVTVRLGEGLKKSRYLAGEPVQRTIGALKLFRDIISFDSIRHVLPVATSAVRDASNKAEFLKLVDNQTGFRFKVLTAQEEAYYSYIGALESTCLPTSLFFDLGGGSLEMVYTENYSIKKFRSFPLGALRLSQKYGQRGVFSKKAYGKMEEHVLDILPEKKEFSMSVDTMLVGVGGTMRAIARYEQELSDYPLDKIHNYRIDYSSISAIAKRLYRMDTDELAETKAIGNNRVDTIVAGSAVISLLMQKLGFDKVVVSARGLRDGIVSSFLHDAKTFYNGSISSERAKAYVIFACQREPLSQYAFSLVRPLVSSGLMREKEHIILTHALKQMAELPSVTNLSNLFHLIIDEDNPFLTHREQLILALSIVRTKKPKTADWLFSRYHPILQPQNMHSIEKISACIMFCAILERSKAMARLSISGSGKKVAIRILQGKQPVPSMLVAEALKNLERSFNITTSCQVNNNTPKGQPTSVRLVA